MIHLRIPAFLLLSTALVLPTFAKRPQSGGVDHKAQQSLPIQLGTSGGWGLDLANGYCCGGTLGSLIRYDGELHILSNFHVLASDVISGGNGVVATIGDVSLGPVIQPGLIDIGCDASQAEVVAILSGSADPLGGGSPNVDAATAQIIEGFVDPSGAILGIGRIADQTLPISEVTLGMGVKKSGRTTGFTRSTIAILNATVNITYENECAGTTRDTATFTGQIVADNNRSSFLDSGDSGSLMVEDVSTTPRAIGLLFAGSSRYAIANPIDDVLARFGDSNGPATMVGDPWVDSGGSDGSPTGPGNGNGRKKPRGGQTGLDRAKSVQNSHAALLEGLENSNGHGVGVDSNGNLYIAVLVESLAKGPRNPPASLNGIPVRLVETGRLVAY